MSLEIKHVADLMGKSFRIPSYQRGYRWERKQIEQLLNDLLEFNDNLEHAKQTDFDNNIWNEEHPNEVKKATNNADKMGYYCLQPLAVTQSSDGHLDVIDGQQRLTTIYLILYYLSNDMPKLSYNPGCLLENSMYKLNYQTRNEDFFTNKMFKNEPSSATSNIDYYFMTKGYETIKNWFLMHEQSESTIMSLLLPTDYKIGKDNRLLHDVRFIWYDVQQSNSISTFSNLNYGKISLTASELVKALLFQCDVYEAEHRDIAKKDAFSRSLKWSYMEENLNDKYFWGMLTNSKYDKDIHMELVLEFVAQNIDSELKYSESEGWKQSDPYWVFHIFSKTISDNKIHNNNINYGNGAIERIEYLWDEIKKVYATFHNWYKNRNIYHKIGLLVHLKTHYGKHKISHLQVIRNLYDNYKNGTKLDFEEYLRKSIGKCVSIESEIEESALDESREVKTCKRKRYLDEINYEEHPNDIRKILLLFNVEELLNLDSERTRFPFQDIDKLKSIEHIHPQHLNEDNIDFNTIKCWYNVRRTIVMTNIDTKNNPDLSSAITMLDKNLENESLFNDNKGDCLANISIIDKQFDELAGMNQDIMHSICNLALVDEPTNSALGNRLLDQKREVLKARGCKSYIPTGTWHAFNKFFSQDVKDLKFWSEPDREAYFSEIKKIYNLYTK